MSATAVATTNAGTTVAKRTSNFEVSLQEYEPQLVAVLPPHISVEKFKRVIITAVNQNPDLAAADRRSLFTSCVKSAQDGLLPDGREAALVIFNTKVKRNGREEWINAVQYMPMIAGIRKRMRNTGEVLSADAAVVYKNDEFDYELGDNQFIKHKPTMGDRGEPIGAYAIIKLANGEIIRDVMGVHRIEKARAVSKSKNGPAWNNWWDEMACKTVLRHASKAAPASAEMERLLSRDDDLDGNPRPTTTVALPQARPRRVDFVEPSRDGEATDADDGEFTGDIANEVSTEMSHDPDTGEVREPATESPASSRHPDDAPSGSTAAATPETATAAPAGSASAGERSATVAETGRQPDGDLLGGKPAPAKAKPAAKPPNSPLKGGNWAAFTPWFVGQIKTLPLAEISEFLANYSAECDAMAGERLDEWMQVEDAQDQRKKAGR